MVFKGFGNATQEQISRFEKHIGFTLPNDYTKFLFQYNGGTPQVKYCTFFVDALKQDIPLNELLGFGKRDLDLYEWNDEYHDDLLPNSVVIGHDPGSGMIILINESESGGIYYWDDSFYFEQSNEEENTYKIADSFQEFIDNLKSPA